MSKRLQDLHRGLIQEIIQQITFGTFNDFASIVEVALDKEKADEFRNLAIQEGKWIRMDGVIYNDS